MRHSEAEEKCLPRFVANLSERGHLEDVGMEGRIILILILKCCGRV